MRLGRGRAKPSPSSILVLNEQLFQDNALRRQHTHFSSLVDDRGGDFEAFRKDESQLAAIKDKSLRKFYENQNELLDLYAEVDDVLDDTVKSPNANEDIERSPLLPKNNKSNRQADDDRRINIIINANLVINVALLAAKIFVVLLSNSVSLLASAIDSAMDLLSTIIIFAASWYISHVGSNTQFAFPTGKRKIEPISIIVFSVFMQASFLQVMIESIQRLFQKDLSIAILPRAGLYTSWATIAIKSLVWVWCRSYKNSSVKALAQDAENDVVFNLASLVFPWLGTWFSIPLLDPIGGVLLSLYIVFDWSETLYEQVINLAGHRASSNQHARCIYLVTRFSPLVKEVQHVSVYHVGVEHVIVETDIIVPPETPLPLAHNVGESVQLALESLPGVERAYVHVDVRSNPSSGHMQRLVSGNGKDVSNSNGSMV